MKVNAPKKDPQLAWHQEGNAYRTSGWETWESTWYGGLGSENRMAMAAVNMKHEVQLMVEEPTEGHRGYMSYKDWDTMLASYAKVPQQDRHVNEIIQHDKKCKPYLDLDNENPPSHLDTYEKVVDRVRKALVIVFEKQYSICLNPADVHFLISENQAKLSSHCIVSTKNPQFVFNSNDRDLGAGHLASSLIIEDPDLKSVIDMNVYTKNRAFRMFASSKYTKPYSILEPYEDYVDGLSAENFIVSHIERHHETIKVPATASTRALKQRLPESRPPRICSTGDETVKRMLILLKSVHPSAYHDPSHGHEDAYDMLRGVKFNYQDRHEKCYTGHLHEGTNNLACWVDEGGNIWCRCFSDKCKGQLKRLGELFVDDRAEYLKDAIFMNSPFVTTKSGLPVKSLRSLITAWLECKFKGLCLKSITGSGKTTLIEYLMNLPEFADEPVLYLTYRQTLAFNVSGGRLGDTFDNYLDLTNAQLADRKQYKKPVCQLDSINKLTRDPASIPKFTLVIIDESEKLFEHLSASTLREPVFIQQKLQHIVRRCRNVLALDALFGAESFEMLQAYDVPMQVVVNEYRRPDPRHYHFTHSWTKIVADILEKLAQKKTIHIASMSTEALHKINEAIANKFPQRDFQIMIHTSKTDDEVKRNLADADELWVDQQMVGASPSVEAGVDCSKKLFDHQYVFANLRSTSASGLFQMVWRIRNLGSSDVMCYAQQGIRLGPGGKRKVTVSECIENLRFIKDKAISNCEREVIIKGDDELLLPKLGPFALATAHNNARRLNSQSRFYNEFADIAESQGHLVSYDLVDNDGGPRKSKVQWRPMNINAKKLVETDMIDEDEFLSIEDRIYRCRASEDDKWKSYKHKYMRSWGIDTVDETFVLENGTEISNVAVKLLIKNTFDVALLFDAENPSEEKLYVVRTVLSDIMRVMGWEHPFHVGKVVCVDEKKEELLQIPFFKEYDRFIKIFNPWAEIHTVWDHLTMFSALETVFRSIGIGIVSERKRKQIKKVKHTSYWYSLNSDSCNKMASLVNLRIREKSGLKPSNSAAGDYLRQVGFGRFARYVRDEGRD